MVSLYLKHGREKPLRMGHPWIFSGAVDRITGKGDPGELCSIYTAQGEFLAIGYYNPHSSIYARVLSYNKVFETDELFYRIKRAVQQRSIIFQDSTNSCRLINSEGDFIPGLIVDKYGAGLVVQILTAGIERMRKEIIEALLRAVSPDFIYERSDTDARKREGLQACQGTLYGNVPSKITLNENGLQFVVNIEAGQKTGFFFDQRSNRELLKKYVPGKSVCDCFSYSGAFSVYALSGGAIKVDMVDSSVAALGWAAENVSGNELNHQKAKFINADVFQYLRDVDKCSYDLFILDPPKFAKHPAEVRRASRGYKDINLLAFKKVAAEGIVFTFSCSNAIDTRLFRQIVFSAAADANRRVQLLHVLSAGPDHPVNIAHQEGEYLKGLVLRVLD